MADERIEHIESMMRTEIQSSIADGWKLVCGTFGDLSMRCGCAVTLAVQGHLVEGDCVTVVAQKRLAISRDELWSITDGFDSNKSCAGNVPEFFELGRRLRDAFSPAEARDA